MRIPRRLLLTLWILAGALVLLLGSFALDRAVHAGQVLRRVTVGEADVSGLGPSDAETRLLQLEDTLAVTAQPFTVSGRTFVLDPAEVDFDLEEGQGVEAALAAGRRGSLPRQLGWWLARLGSPEVLPVPVSLDRAALAAVFDDWEQEAIEDPPFPGAVLVEETRPVPEYPRPGRGIDREPATGMVAGALASTQDDPVTLPVVTVQPVLTREDVDRALEEAERLLAGPVTLARQDPEVEVTLSVAELASALRSHPVVASPASLRLFFDPERVATLLEPLREELEVPPRDASFRVNADDTVSVVPGRPGTRIDPERTAEALMAAAEAPRRTGPLPFEEGAQPEFTTQDARELGIVRKVSEFTTQHACCEPRVTNIHLIADIVDGAIVRPGETFSMNDYVGRRTADRGFVSAPVIYAGEYTEDIGGGVSQFATTFYNAIFFGGYEDVEHQPHSYYISRYPEGREATISWPKPDVIFRNDTKAGVLIRTSHTDTSITVAFYGDNGGRQVEAGLSGRFNFTDPPLRYEADPALVPEEEEVLEDGARGWTVVVYQTITTPDGQTVEEEWPVRYRPMPRVVAVHPCRIPEGEEGHTGEPCPTTTVPETTTTPTTETTTGGE